MISHYKAEQWRDVTEFSGKYQVSDIGRVKSQARLSSCERRSAYRVSERMLTPWRGNTGYLCVTLSDGTKRRKFLIHRLVAEAFIPNPGGLPQVNHKNGDKTDNRVDNLEWCDGRLNSWHNAYVLRNESTIKKKPVKCLTTGRVYPSAAEAARRTGCHNQNLVKCCQGKRKHTGGLAWAYAEEVETCRP